MTPESAAVKSTLVLPHDAPREEWLAARRAGIGASEISAVVGLNRWRGPWDVWSSKVEGIDGESSDAARWGLWLEDRIADWWAAETGRTTIPGGLYRDVTHPWMLATPDRLLVEDGAVSAVVDAKHGNWRGLADWEDGAPLEYVCQITWQMLVLGVRRGFLVAAIGGHPPMEREFTLDDDLAADLIRQGRQFWTYVQQRTPPPIDGSDLATSWLSDRYPKSIGEQVPLDETAVSAVAQWVEADALERSARASKKAAENTLKARLGDAEAGVYNGRRWVTWTTVERAGYTVEPTTYRKFTVPKHIREELDGHRN